MPSENTSARHFFLPLFGVVAVSIVMFLWLQFKSTGDVASTSTMSPGAAYTYPAVDVTKNASSNEVAPVQYNEQVVTSMGGDAPPIEETKTFTH